MKTVATCLLGLMVASSAVAAEEGSARSIALTVPRAEYLLGEAILVKVAYKNAQKDPWELAQPDLAMGPLIHYQLPDRPETKQSVRLNGETVDAIKLPNGGVHVLWIVPSPSKIEIAGGSSYLFSFYFFTYWAEWKAGSLVVWVEDTKEKVVSNQISISVAFQKGSIPLLLDLVAKEPAPLPSSGRITPEMRRAILRRKQAAEWLSKLDPTFQIDEVREQDDAATKAGKIAANEKAVRTFREFWEAKKDSDEVKAVFAKLNEDTARKPVK